MRVCLLHGARAIALKGHYLTGQLKFKYFRNIKVIVKISENYFQYDVGQRRAFSTSLLLKEGGTIGSVEERHFQIEYWNEKL